MEAIRNIYANMGVENYYKKYKDCYCNPHENVVRKILSNEHISGTVLDLCCGSGEVTRSINANVVGCDPYTNELYKKQTGRPCLSYSFNDIAEGKLHQQFDVIICSFALHLCPKSLLPSVLYRLTESSDELIILTPHKRPEIDVFWKMYEERIVDKVRIRKYRSTLVK